MPAVPLKIKVACVMHLIEAKADTALIQNEYYEHTGEIPTLEQVRGWRKQLGYSRDSWVEAKANVTLDPFEREAVRLQALVRKYWHPVRFDSANAA